MLPRLMVKSLIKNQYQASAADFLARFGINARDFQCCMGEISLAI